MAKYTLPDLSYDYGALEPHISGKIVELHHDKHHAAYVKGANTAMDKLQEARDKGDFASVAAVEHDLAFNLSGHILHSIYWQNLTPGGGGEPGGELGAAIQRDFGSFAAFKAQLGKAATTITGSGWGALMFEPTLRRLTTAQIHDHQAEASQGSVPLLVIDAWEHAYYLQYFNDKAKYEAAIWNLVNWADVAQRLAGAQRLFLGLEGVATGADTAVPATH